MSSTTTHRQPTRRLPLLPTGIDRTDDLGVVGLRCRATLRLTVEDGRPPAPFSFVVDSGAYYSIINLGLAQLRRISMDLLGPEIVLQPTTAQGPTPMRIRPGRVRAWWDADLRGHHFDWPVLFRVGAPLGVPSILGLGGIVKMCSWTFDGSYSPDSPYGYLILEDMR